MATTFLSDDVINSTELRKNQRHWLERAYTNPVSIKSGTKNLVLINRDHAKDMYLMNHYAKMIIQFCQERISELEKSVVFPWTEHLNKEEIIEFEEELLATSKDVIHSGNWAALEELLTAWVATAEAKTNPEILELINPKGRSREYVRLKR